MNRTDLTNPDNFTKYLGSFWNNIFDSGLFASAVGTYSSHELAQIYKDLVVAVNSCSVDTVPIYRRESVFPLVLSKSEMEDNTTLPTYGSGLYYGQQPQVSPAIGDMVIFGLPYREKDLYFIDLPDDLPFVENNSIVAMERLYGGSILWVNGVDFLIRGKRIIFKQDPFSLSAFPKRLVRKNGVDDLEIVIWFCEVDFDKNDIFRNFGSIFSKTKTSSPEYKEVCKSFFSLVSYGASIDKIDSLFSAAAASPLIKEDEETVTCLAESPEGVFVETDKNLYKIPSGQGVKEEVEVGSVLNKGFALTDVVRVIDTKKNPDWWKELDMIPAAGVFANDNIKFLSFPNKTSGVSFRTVGENTFIRFEVVGDEKSIDAFWSDLDKNIVATGIDVASHLEDDINPAEFFTQSIAPSIILPIIIDLSAVSDVPFLFSSISSTINQLKGVFPVYAFVYVMLKVELEDEYDLEGFSEDSFESVHRSPGIQTDTLDCGENTFAIEKVLVKYRSKCSL